MPRPVVIGLNYYRLRHQEYMARHAGLGAASPPHYYLAYGDKYCRHFCLQLRRWLSRMGQVWIDRTCELLQHMIEAKRAQDPQAFARLEEDEEAFRRFAYSTHATAYILGGITTLPLRDLLLVVGSIDLTDLLNLYALVQVTLVASHFISVKLINLLNNSTTLLNQLGYQRRPAGLVAGPNACAVVAVEVLVEQNIVAPVRVGLELVRAAKHRPLPVCVT